MKEYAMYEYDNRRNYWYIYRIDSRPMTFEPEYYSVTTLYGPYTKQMQNSIAAICDAINSAVDLAEKLKNEE